MILRFYFGHWMNQILEFGVQKEELVLTALEKGINNSKIKILKILWLDVV